MSQRRAAFHHGFFTELSKLGAARERAYVRTPSGSAAAKPAGVLYSTVRKGATPIRAANLLSKIGQVPSLASLMGTPLFWGALAGLGAGYMGHQTLQDARIGKQVREAQRR